MKSDLICAAVVAALLASCQRSTPPTRPHRPQRIVSQAVLADEVLWRLGPDVQQRVVAVSRLADDERYSGAVGWWPAEIPKVGGAGESIVGLRPDLVILAPFTSEELKAILAGAGIATVLIRGLASFDDYRRNTETIADAVAATQAGAELVAAFDRRLQEMSKRPRQSRTVTSWVDGIVAGNPSTFDDAVTAAGLFNIASLNGIHGHKRISLERLVIWDPDMIVIGCADDCDSTAARFAASVGISGTRAARRSGIIAVPYKILSSTGEAMLDLVGILIRRTPAVTP